jgi:hypothetical protein
MRGEYAAVVEGPERPLGLEQRAVELPLHRIRVLAERRRDRLDERVESSPPRGS